MTRENPKYHSACGIFFVDAGGPAKLGINFTRPEHRYLKFVNYGRLETTRPTERKAKLHLQNTLNINNNEAKIALDCASILNGLERYPDSSLEQTFLHHFVIVFAV